MSTRLFTIGYYLVMAWVLPVPRPTPEVAASLEVEPSSLKLALQVLDSWGCGLKGVLQVHAGSCIASEGLICAND